ncbi:MAG: TIGR02996 domain-containing protein [Planctomycetes bacterium]|nr:TIGR02996 domain-containing protein [Planctomycetota bacterium]
MNDHDALLTAIGEHPEEDTPRLMYADWLEESGQSERADFVRTQVGVARPGLSAADRYPFVRKNVHYLTNFVPGWKAELPQLDGIAWGDFNRGLIEEFEAESEKPLVKHARTVFAVPGVHILRLRRLDAAARLAKLPELARLRALKMVSPYTTATALRALFASPHLARLRVLDLHGQTSFYIHDPAVDTVAADIADGRFPDLEELWLGSNRIGNDGAMALAHSPHLDKLRVLDLRNNPFTALRAELRRRFGSALKM